MLKYFSLFIVCILHANFVWCLQINTVLHAVSCNGGSDGSVEIDLTESTSEYTLRLLMADGSRVVRNASFSGDTLVKITDLKAGNYKLLLIEGVEKSEKVFVISEPDPLKANVIEVINYPSTTESCDGVIKINPSGGTEPYTYKWSENTGNSSLQRVEGLCEGIYRCFVTDIENCDTVSATVYLYENLKKNAQ